MSRFPELFEEAIDRVVIGEAFLVEELAEHIARHIVERQQAVRAEVRIVAQYPLERTTPVTGLPTQDMAALHGIAAASPARRAPRDRRRGDGHQRLPVRAGPRARRRHRPAARGRIRGRRGREDPRPRPACDPQPARHGHALVGTEASLNAEDLVGIVERSMSAPVHELLKRPDELHVVEQAHLHPRFVEDSVRLSLAAALRGLPAAGRGRLPLRAPGQLRDDPHARRRRRAHRDGRRAARRARDRVPAPRHTELRDWLSA